MKRLPISVDENGRLYLDLYRMGSVESVEPPVDRDLPPASLTMAFGGESFGIGEGIFDGGVRQHEGEDVSLFGGAEAQVPELDELGRLTSLLSKIAEPFLYDDTTGRITLRATTLMRLLREAETEVRTSHNLLTSCDYDPDVATDPAKRAHALFVNHGLVVENLAHWDWLDDDYKAWMLDISHIARDGLHQDWEETCVKWMKQPFASKKGPKATTNGFLYAMGILKRELDNDAQ